MYTEFVFPRVSEKEACVFHHVGFVVPAILPVVAQFGASFGVEWDRNVFHDPLQAVRVAFLNSKLSAHPSIELVEPAGSDSPVHQFLQRGGGLHHICYEVDSLDIQLERSRRLGELVVRSPLPAIAFNNRRIAWVYTTNKLLLEFLEREARF
jgi:methylmalonyl-CoA/ethylmalonyl-CoA epimerase